jgi:RimJ/RimL family protein N-acetyltransferase
MLQTDSIEQIAPSRRRLATPAPRDPAIRDPATRDPQPRIVTLTASDLPLVARFLVETDVHTRTSRFGSAASDANLVAHANDTLKQARLLLGLLFDGKLRGLLEVHDCSQRRMEVALIVATAFRRRGFATALLREAIACADLIDARIYQLIFAPENWPMRRIAQKSNARLDLVFGEYCAEIDLTRG